MKAAKDDRLCVAVDCHIERVLGESKGCVSEAARRLGVHRRSLQRWLSGKRVSKMRSGELRRSRV